MIERCLLATTVLLGFLLAGCVIRDPAPEDCKVETVTVSVVREGRRVTLHVVRNTRHVARTTFEDGTIVYDEFERDRS